MSFSCKWHQYSLSLHLFPSSPHPSLLLLPSSIPRCTQETLAPLKVESVFLFHCVFFPPRWKSPRPTLAERLTQVCSDVPTFLDSIPNTGTVYCLSRECWFPAQVFIRPSLGRECNRNSLSNTNHYTTQTFPPCQSSYTQINAEVFFRPFFNIRCKACAGSSYEKYLFCWKSHSDLDSNSPLRLQPHPLYNPAISEDLVHPGVKKGVFLLLSALANPFMIPKKDKAFQFCCQKLISLDDSSSHCCHSQTAHKDSTFNVQTMAVHVIYLLLLQTIIPTCTTGNDTF